MRLTSAILSLLFVLTTEQVFASAPLCDLGKVGSERQAGHKEATSLFKNVFSDREFYSPGECATNIAKLLKHFKENGIDISNSKVHYLTSPAGFNVNESRQFLNEWSYHTILELDGKIYDFDFTKVPTVLDTKTYFKRNIFPSNIKDPESLDRFLTFQSTLTVPATSFLEQHPTNKSGSKASKDFMNWLQTFSWVKLKDFAKDL